LHDSRLIPKLATRFGHVDNARAMATAIISTGPADGRLDPATQSPVARAADSPQFRFGLRQLLLFVAVICALLAAVASTNGLTALVLWIAAGVVAMHVFATALGSRLRSETDYECPFNSLSDRDDVIAAKGSERSARIAAIQSAPRSPWHGRGSTYLPWLPRMVVAAMVGGGLGGAVLLDLLVGHRVSPAGIVVGAASFAVLCGWGSFLGGNFYGVFRHGFREALAEQQRDDLAARHIRTD